MKKLHEQMAFYAGYHQDPRNIFTHFIGIPLIIYSLLIIMSWARISLDGLYISLSMLFVLLMLIYYFMLDIKIAISSIFTSVGILFLAEWTVNSMDRLSSFWIFLATFICGWGFQIIGHIIEGRRPALLSNFFQVFIAPLFLIAEVYFKLGIKKDLEENVIQGMLDNLKKDGFPLHQRYKKRGYTL